MCVEFAYSVVNALSPENASCATRDILLLDKSMRRNRLKFANDFGGNSVIKFCSNRLYMRKKKQFLILQFA